ncbi:MULTISPECIES: ExeA family protein [Pectobacterium]|uniref:ExeA family protein n=1 Tax=Pectobacterium TaxID=122277 RepID=UPI001F0EFB00|nr:AAA family ATPase [Pectobacterium aquaticum]MCH5051174.1 AAA family ATPase [Pectobacterium aquaticum]
MLQLKTIMANHGINQGVLATAAGISQPAIAQLVNHGIWPKRDAEGIRQSISRELSHRGIDPNGAFEEVPAASTTTGADVPQQQASDEETENMLLKKQVLRPATKKAFGMFRDPFADDAMQGAEDVFTTPDIRYVREALYQTARHGGLMAVIGESGAGKSTLRRDLIERINRENAPIIVIEPYVLAMEDNDVKGKTLKAAAIAEAIISTIAPLEGIKRSQDARFRQLHRVLKESSAAGYSHVLVIEEAHSLPIPTLKHLKRFFELESGFKKLLSIVLIGQPELAVKLSERNMEVREVVQRCEVVELLPLDNSLEDFLQFKFGRAGKKLTEIVDGSAIDAIRGRLSNPVNNRKSIVSLLYPLAVGNLLIAAMNLAAEIGVPVVNADVIKGV